MMEVATKDLEDIFFNMEETAYEPYREHLKRAMHIVYKIIRHPELKSREDILPLLFNNPVEEDGFFIPDKFFDMDDDLFSHLLCLRDLIKFLSNRIKDLSCKALGVAEENEHLKREISSLIEKLKRQAMRIEAMDDERNITPMKEEIAELKEENERLQEYIRELEEK